MVNASKAKGTAAETAVVNYLKDSGWIHAERRSLSGANDRGDIAGVIGVVIEVKAEKSLKLSQWLKEAHTEQINDGADLGVVWHKKIGTTKPADWYVTMEGGTFAFLLKQAGY